MTGDLHVVVDVDLGASVGAVAVGVLGQRAEKRRLALVKDAPPRAGELLERTGVDDLEQLRDRLVEL